MATFKVQVEDLIGAVGDDDLITDSLLASGAEIIEKTPDAKLLKSSDEIAIDSTSGLDVSSKKVLGVHVSNKKARYYPYSDIGRAKDSNSIHYAKSTDPVYYFKGEKIFVVYDGSESNQGKLIYVPIQPTSNGTALVDSGDSATALFPLEAEKLMVMGASVRCLKRIIADQINTDEDPELAQLSLAQLQSLEATYEKEFQKYLT